MTTSVTRVKWRFNFLRSTVLRESISTMNLLYSLMSLWFPFFLMKFLPVPTTSVTCVKWILCSMVVLMEIILNLIYHEAVLSYVTIHCDFHFFLMKF